MTDFGRVGHIKSLDTDATFMVIAPSDEEFIRRGMTDYRIVINLSGIGYMNGTPIPPGHLGAVKIDADFIEWLDD